MTGDGVDRWLSEVKGNIGGDRWGVTSFWWWGSSEKGGVWRQEERKKGSCRVWMVEAQTKRKSDWLDLREDFGIRSKSEAK